jgi:hypothetical protein
MIKAISAKKISSTSELREKGLPPTSNSVVVNTSDKAVKICCVFVTIQFIAAQDTP